MPVDPGTNSSEGATVRPASGYYDNGAVVQVTATADSDSSSRTGPAT